MAEMDSTAIYVALRGSEIAASALYTLLHNLLHKDSSYLEPITDAFKARSTDYESVQITDDGIKVIQSGLNKYSVDFQIIKDKNSGELSILFKGKDIQQMYNGINSYMSTQPRLKKEAKKSLKDIIRDAVLSASSRNETVKSREPKTREYER